MVAPFCPQVLKHLMCLQICLGPVVQNVVSLPSSLRVISLTVLADSIHNILIFFAEKNVSSFCLFVRLSLWCWRLDVDLIVSVPEFSFYFDILA